MSACVLLVALSSLCASEREGRPVSQDETAGEARQAMPVHRGARSGAGQGTDRVEQEEQERLRSKLGSMATEARIVTLGAGVTETVAALGLADRIVAVDTTSRWPEQLASRPRVGYVRALSAEGLLSFRPTRVIASQEAGPPAALDAIRAARVPLVLVPEARDWGEAKARMRAVGAAVDREAAVEALVRDQDARLARLAERLEARPRPKVLFLFSLGRSPVVGGRRSIADAMIALAGGQVALPEIEGFRPPVSEVIAASAPEVILTTPRVLASMGGVAGLSGLPGFTETPALRNGRVVTLDDTLLLAFGPRTALAVEALAAALHPGLEEG